MRLYDAFKTSLNGLTHSKIRTILTMLGIVIGISSVILLMSIGRSAQVLILSQVQGIGSNLIFVIPGATKGSKFASPPSVQGIIIKTLVRQDLEALQREPAVEKATAEVRGIGRVVYGNTDTDVTYEGTTEDFFTVRNFKVDRGTTFTDSDVDSFNRVAVIGSSIAKTLFGNEDPLNKVLRIKDVSFRILGVLEKKGLGPFGVDQDNLVLIPISVAQKQMVGIDYYNAVTLQIRDNYDIEFAKARINSVLRQNHHITNPDKDDFTVRTQEDALSLLGSITSVMTIFLTAIAFISLIVGGIGIMNIMLVSVVERTREIGLRKALGATDRDILEQFLFEAGMITFIGGLIGIAIGALLTVAVYFVVVKILQQEWAFQLPGIAIALAASVSTFIGVVFGLYPARQASRKNPIEALRYE